MVEPLLVVVPCAIAGAVIVAMLALTWNTLHRQGSGLLHGDYIVDNDYLSSEQRWTAPIVLLSTLMLVASLGMGAGRDWGLPMFAAMSLLTALVMLVAFGVVAKRRVWSAEKPVADYEPTTYETMPGELGKAHVYVPSHPTESHIYDAVVPLSVVPLRYGVVSPAPSPGGPKAIVPTPIAFQSSFAAVPRPEPVPLADLTGETPSEETATAATETEFSGEQSPKHYREDFSEDASAL